MNRLHVKFRELDKALLLLQGAAQALGHWDQAMMRLQSAASLDVGDVSPLNALGDVHSGRADLLFASQPVQVRHICRFQEASGHAGQIECRFQGRLPSNARSTIIFSKA